jgi:peptidoglycan/LPS O-acetylase OafA/YrhL
MASAATIEPPAPPSRARLDHVDAMRPVKQLGVLSTHCLLAFAPGGAAVGAALLLLHASREGFLFVSACMLTYSYRSLTWTGLGMFWRRRLLAVGVPYLCWTLIYFLVGLPSFGGSPTAAVARLAFLMLTGYSQLYFLVVLLQFYVLFPAVLRLLRRTSPHHVLLLAGSAAMQVAYVSLVHWNIAPGFLAGAAGTREASSYQFYLLAGSLAAIHYEKVHAWLTRHTGVVVISAVATAALAELWYWLSVEGVTPFLGGSSDPSQPIVVPFNIAAIALIYVIGIVLVGPRSSIVERRMTRSASNNSYAIYLSQVLFIDILAALGWRRLDGVVPWPCAVALAVAIVFGAGWLLGGIVGRTPLAWPVAGRHLASWSSLRPWFVPARPGPPAPAGADGPPLARPAERQATLG